MNKETVVRFLKKLDKDKIEYCILRNYESFDENKDLDILINYKDGRRVKNILKDFEMVKRVFKGGPYWLCNCKADVKIGCIDCDGRFFESAKGILKRRRRYKNFYVLGFEDELEHLIVHPIVTKGHFKEKYKKKIEAITEDCDLEIVRGKLVARFGKVGGKVLDAILKKNYTEALKYRKEMQKEVRTFKNFMKYYFCRVHFFCKKKVMK